MTIARQGKKLQYPSRTFPSSRIEIAISRTIIIISSFSFVNKLQKEEERISSNSVEVGQNTRMLGALNVGKAATVVHDESLILRQHETNDNPS